MAKAERREGAAAAAAAARADLALAQAAVDADNAVKGARRARGGREASRRGVADAVREI